MSEILPIVLMKLQKVGLLLDFCIVFFVLDQSKQIPSSEYFNATFLRGCTLVFIGQYLTDGPLDECMKFWKVFYRLFHGKALRFMADIKSTGQVTLTSQPVHFSLTFQLRADLKLSNSCYCSRLSPFHRANHCSITAQKP